MKVIETIGKTPLVQLQHIGGGRIYAKMEKTNPGASIKDRPAYAMIRDAIESGALKPGMTIVEPTSGNTGIALALIGKQLGYPVELFMPASMSKERVRLMESFGAKVTLTTEGALQGAVDAAKARVAEGDAYMPDQFSNPSNPKAHYETTGPEIYEALPDIAAFVSGFGTGGTISGVGKYLKEKDPAIQVYGFEPAESPLVTEGHAAPHRIQGISGNFVPKNLDKSVVDEFFTISDQDAIDMARRLSAEEGLSVGISSGANVAAALLVSEKIAGNIVTVLPDLGERYMSTVLYEAK
ncbi:MAG: cysteine synthase A [Peptoniphilaceae bacterium]|nr:cysteine synthase A [Peptoniphilaceae bacterium]